MGAKDREEVRVYKNHVIRVSSQCSFRLDKLIVDLLNVHMSELSLFTADEHYTHNQQVMVIRKP